MIADRRVLLGLLAGTFLTGGASAHPMAEMSGINLNLVVSHFPQSRHDALDRFVELVIPTSDTPGARDAGVTGFIELLYGNWMTDEEKSRCDAEIDRVMTAFTKHGDASANLYIDGRIIAPTLRKLTIYSYYTSEIGAAEELDLNLVPGIYDACDTVGPTARAPSLYTWGITLDLTKV